MRCRVVAWGHETKPNLDIEYESSTMTAERKQAMVRGYLFVSTRLLEAISREALDRALDAEFPSDGQ